MKLSSRAGLGLTFVLGALAGCGTVGDDLFGGTSAASTSTGAGGSSVTTGAGGSTVTTGAGGSSVTTGAGGSSVTTGAGGASVTTGAGGATTTTSAGGSSGTGGQATTGTGTGGSPPVECAMAADCDALLGAAPCGSWACAQGVCEASSPGCTDADHDGYGAGAACQCAGLDCDDTDEKIGASAVASCYLGPAGTLGVGTCHAGSKTCNAGVFGPCVGQVTPSGEACNAQDDDCNGVVDDGLGTFKCGLGACQTTVGACSGGVVASCVPGAPAGAVDGPACNGVDDDCDGAIDEDCKQCVPVAKTGNDLLADGTFLQPFATIQAAIDWAAAHPAGPQTVCVAAGAICGTAQTPVTGTYPSAANATITMADGVSVLGNYESTTYARCPASTTTVIQPKTGAGVTFPASVSKTTVLDGFRIERFNASTTSGVTVSGGKGVILSNLTIQNTPQVMSSYGISILQGGDATLSKSRVDAGNGSVESIGVRVVGARVTIDNNCLSLNAQGRCDDFCSNNPSIRGRTVQGTGATYAVLLDGAPGSLVQASAMCANDADQGAAVRIKGDGKGIEIRGNLINAFGGLNDSHGIWMEDCQDAAPWIVDNQLIAAAGINQQTRVAAVYAVGACHPVVDSNQLIVGGGEGQASNPTGVFCGKNAGGQASQCVVLGNLAIQGSQFGFPPIAIGVRCEDGGCMRVADNTITGRGGTASYGVWLGKTGTVVDNNLIRGGCSPTAVGLRADNSFARVQNNRIFGFTASDCGNGVANPQQSIGLQVFIVPGVNEIDVHSNDLDGAGVAAACASRGLEIGISAAPPAQGIGIYRNNIVRAGLCSTLRYNVMEANGSSDPRIFEHNDLDPANAPTALYLDENAAPLASAAAVNALGDMTVNGTLSVDPQFVAYPNDLHLKGASMCIGQGTPTGAPTSDLDGDARDPVTPDIGADEH
ncbi:MAG: hypothetical protein ABI193_15275 [Minicystis sp.]